MSQTIDVVEEQGKTRPFYGWDCLYNGVRAVSWCIPDFRRVVAVIFFGHFYASCTLDAVPSLHENNRMPLLRM
jgi:hypothetical protein